MVGYTVEHRLHRPLHKQPRGEQIEALERVEADDAVVAEALGGQHDYCGDPTERRNIAKDGSRTGRNAREEFAVGGPYACTGWREPHFAQNTSRGFTSLPQWLQKGIYQSLRYGMCGCSRKRHTAGFDSRGPVVPAPACEPAWRGLIPVVNHAVQRYVPACPGFFRGSHTRRGGNRFP